MYLCLSKIVVTMAMHNDLGRWGEDKATDYLIKKGYRICNRDWHYGHRDIDIIALKNNVLAIVEVKTRRNDTFMQPELAVDHRKVRSLMIAANAYVKSYRIDYELRFDIIAVTGVDDNSCVINHIESAFTPLPY